VRIRGLVDVFLTVIILMLFLLIIIMLALSQNYATGPPYNVISHAMLQITRQQVH